MEMYQANHIRRNKDEYDKINYTAWLQGSYIVRAVQTALYGKKAKYPDKPYSKSEESDTGEELDIYEVFRRRMRAMNERIKENDNEASD
jgi:hypothetical protein